MYPGNGIILKPKCMTGTNSMPKIQVSGQHDQCEVEGAVECSSELDQVSDQLILISAINHPKHEGLSVYCAAPPE